MPPPIVRLPPAEVPLPRPLQALLGQVKPAERHPGLQLDKYLLPCPQQEQQRDVLAAVAAIPGHPELLTELRARRAACLAALGVAPWARTTAGPLTLHLARASALENAGLCLHPVYGFAYLPATGLKGLARAYAETVWLRDQPDPKAAWATIEAVFGWAPGSDVIGKDEHHKPVIKPWKPKDFPEHARKDSAASGQITFHDAWPLAWPKLFVDIVNNHHPAYYTDGEDPGDWESPNPVYFLAVPTGTAFDFALGKRRADVPEALLDLARTWLEGGLTHLGAGAKTAAGYGAFSPPARPINSAAIPLPTALATFEATLELATPAFLAGANQRAEDCDLRPATLRGLLRWWWRTMHAGFVDVVTLRRMEAAVWGDTNQGGAVRVTVERASVMRPRLYDCRDGFRVVPAFAQEHQLRRPPGDRPTTQGLFYASYGMNDGGRQRYYLPAGAAWTVRVVARRSAYQERDARGKVTRIQCLLPEVLLGQAKAALWLLCHLGGVGSKARKGFGSLADLADLRLEDCRQTSAVLRDACGVTASAQPRAARSPSLDQILSPPTDPRPWLEVDTFWADPWTALDETGFAAQAFAQSLAHETDKCALGLPRQIHGPRREPMPHQRGTGRHRPPQRLDGPLGDRHAAPVFYHLAKKPDGYLQVRVTAFLTPDLPDAATSKRVLDQLLAHLQSDLQQRVTNSPRQGPPRAETASPPAALLAKSTAPGPAKRPHGSPAKVTILAVRGKGGFDVQEVGQPKGVLNQGKAPPALPTVGTTITVYVFDDARTPVYRWDAPPPPPAGRKPTSGPRSSTPRRR